MYLKSRVFKTETCYKEPLSLGGLSSEIPLYMQMECSKISFTQNCIFQGRSFTFQTRNCLRKISSTEEGLALFPTIHYLLLITSTTERINQYLRPSQFSTQQKVHIHQHLTKPPTKVQN